MEPQDDFPEWMTISAQAFCAFCDPLAYFFKTLTGITTAVGGIEENSVQWSLEYPKNGLLHDGS